MVGNVRSAVLTENVCFDEKVRFVGLTRKVFFAILAENAFLRIWREMCILVFFYGKTAFLHF